MRREVDDVFGRVVMVVGMQYGSERKGETVRYLAPGCSIGARTGAINAAHTTYFRGRKFVMRQIPTVWVNPYAKLVLGLGALISPEVLLEEIRLVEQFLPVRERLLIDRNAHVITPAQIQKEGATNLAERIGSTSAILGEGIGVATAEKVLRAETCLQAKDVPELQPYLADTVDVLNEDLERDGIVLLEGTQGFGLSLEHGEFPYVTSRDTSAAALAASMGVSPHYWNVQVIGVIRTYPIRVAGNSGPFGKDSEEISWEEVTRRARAPEPIIERTSATHNVRRVATFSDSDFKRACRVNRPTELALGFADYLDWGVHDSETISRPVEKFMDRVERLSGVEVTMVGTGPHTTIDFDDYRRSILRRIRED
jgi:adenylosuccinate synthase